MACEYGPMAAGAWSEWMAIRGISISPMDALNPL
jgi:hypothetical protein